MDVLPTMTSNERVGPRTLSTDDLLDALANAERRRLLLELLERDRGADGALAVDDFADDTGTWQSRIDLEHRHLPKLERLGLVRWDRVDTVVTRGPEFAEVEPLLILLREHSDRLLDDWA